MNAPGISAILIAVGALSLSAHVVHAASSALSMDQAER